MSSVDADFAAADAMFAEAFGVLVTYLRGVDETVLTAEVQLHDYEISSQGGTVTVVRSRDYLLSASDLGLTPRVGDQIKETIGGVVKLFEVMPIGDRPCFEEADPSQRKLLVHTKYAGNE